MRLSFYLVYLLLTGQYVVGHHTLYSMTCYVGIYLESFRGVHPWSQNRGFFEDVIREA